MSIDTLGYVKRLEAAGVPRPQAEAQAEALRDEISPQLATKHDLNVAVITLATKVDTSAFNLETKITRVEAEFKRLEQRMEALLLRHTIATILGVLAAGSFLVRFLR